MSSGGSLCTSASQASVPSRVATTSKPQCVRVSSSKERVVQLSSAMRTFMAFSLTTITAAQPPTGTCHHRIISREEIALPIAWGGNVCAQQTVTRLSEQRREAKSHLSGFCQTLFRTDYSVLLQYSIVSDRRAKRSLFHQFLTDPRK